MNSYLVLLVTKWVSIICLSLSNNFATYVTFESENMNGLKNAKVGATEIAYKTDYVYTDSLPSGTSITKIEGKNGLAYEEDGEITHVIEEPVSKVVEVGTGEVTEYVGKLTGYGADCAGCSGFLSCRVKNGSGWNLARDGQVYNDSEYGNVRILAASLDKFPCGSIVKVENSYLGTFNAIVLDTGGSMMRAMKNGIVHMDLAYVTQKDPNISKTTSNNIKYTLLRKGW